MMPVRPRRCAGLVLVFVVSWLMFSCTVSPPSLVNQRVDMQYVDDQDLGQRYEQLSVFVHVQDGDGIGDLEFLYIIHDESHQYWKLSADTWQRVEENDTVWLGSSGLTTADYSPLPRGSYRILVIDRAGERDESSTRLAVPSRLNGDAPQPVFAQLSLQAGEAGEAGEAAETLFEIQRAGLADETLDDTAQDAGIVVRVMDGRGRRVQTLRAGTGTYTREDLLGEDRAAGSMRVYLELPPKEKGMPRRISGPYRP